MLLCTKSVSARAAKQGRGWWGGRNPPPLNFGRGIECLSTPSDFEEIFFNCSHVLLCTGYFYRRGGGGGWFLLN